MSKDQSDHKYGYKFGNTDRGILLSILMASLALVAVAGGTVLTTAPGVVIGVGLALLAPCFKISLILIILTIASYIIYRLASWVEEQCRNLCKCKWFRPWCCLGKLFCWLVTIIKWVALVVTAILGVFALVTLLMCIGTIIIALF